MPLKSDEIRTASAMTAFFKSQFSEVSVREGEDPPDCYIIIDGRHTALEISSLHEQILTVDRNNEYKREAGVSFFMSRENLVKDLNKEFEGILTPPRMVFLSMRGFSRDNKKFKKSLRRELADFIDTAKISERRKLTIENTEVTFSMRDSPNGDRIFGMITPSMDLADLNTKTQDALNAILNKKADDCRNLEKPVWLALQFTGQSSFGAEHLRNINPQDIRNQFFDRIFIVEIDGGVFELGL